MPMGSVIMGILAFLVVGLLAGWLAGVAMGGRGHGVAGNVAVGVVGALLGGLAGSALFGWDVGGFSSRGVVVASMGALLALLLLQAFPGGRPSER
jgi:uncharacterized membrane protein YeaQ/YmgE (transglycosylase-associated protein family)